ncbi:hypothetical protein Tco_0954226 [Tanacetum coccineum]|uniref:Uncharacterized protein n=1 Tax=Tanacetum coccineum TaxID=301880 RepID=A0ABQ5E3U7_9ASTR
MLHTTSTCSCCYQTNCVLDPITKDYDLMDCYKKVDLEHVHCPPESKILTNIIKNHPLRFSIAASSSVPWIYMAQFWHTLKEDGSKYRLRFMLDKKELSLTLDDFRTIFHLPHELKHNHNSFVPPPSFSDMVPFYKQQLGFTMELKTSQVLRQTGSSAPWRSARLTPPAPVPTVDKADEMILQDTLQVRDRSDKESPEVERTNVEELEVTNVVIPVNVNEEEDEITDDNEVENLQVQKLHVTFCLRSQRSGRSHDDVHPGRGELVSKRQETLEYEVMLSGDQSHHFGQVNEEERGHQLQIVDEIPSSKVSQEFSKKKDTPLVQAVKRDLKHSVLSLINQDLLYLKKGSSGPEKIVLSLHKFPTIIFNDDDIEEQTSR